MDREPTDNELVTRCQGGDKAAFGELIERYQDRILNLVYRKVHHYEEACDITQEVFLRAYRGLKSFKGESKFYTWLFRIALNTSFSGRKRQARHAQVRSLTRMSMPDDDDGPTYEPADERRRPEENVLAREEEALVMQAIEALPEDQRNIILLRDIEGLAYEEIADILDIPLGSVKSKLHRSRAALRTKLERILKPG